MDADTTKQEIRVRFAPSPTGHLHIGSLRTALFNWLFARHYDGQFLLRIEDTDRERSRDEYTNALVEMLAWAGITHDESLIKQSDRFDEYTKAIESLRLFEKIYYCFCSPEDLIARNKQAYSGDYAFVNYDEHCRYRTVTEDDLQRPYVIRFALPKDREFISFDDIIRGPMRIGMDQLEDFIIVRSDGMPLYNFVVVVDDAHTRISHVIRGEDHLTNTFKQLLLYEASGYDVPQFAHIPLILGPSGDRLSKRDAATAVSDYRKQGYLPEGLINYLARLGWSHGDQELFTRAELIEYFSLNDVGKKGSIFDEKKLAWVNGTHMKTTSEEHLLKEMVAYVIPDCYEQLSRFNKEQVVQLVSLYKERTATLKMLFDELLALHNGPTVYDQNAVDTYMTSETVEHLKTIITELHDVSLFTQKEIREIVTALCKKMSLKLVAITQPLRIALVGTSSSPGIFELVALLGKEESIKRMNTFIAYYTHMS